MFTPDTLQKITAAHHWAQYYSNRGYADLAAKHRETRDLLITSLLTFSTREEYLAWVAEWKQAVSTHVTNVRTYRAARKASRPNYNPYAQSHRIGERRMGFALYMIRDYSKQLAGQQRAENKLVVAE